MVQRRVTKKIFVEPNLRALIGWIKAAIDAQLPKKVPMTCPLRVEKERKPRIKQETVVRIDQRRRALVDKVTFEIDQAA